MSIIVDPLMPQSSFGKVLRSRWYGIRGVINEIWRLVEPSRDRIALNVALTSLTQGTPILFGGPNGSLGRLEFKNTGLWNGMILKFNVDEDPALVASDLWIEANVFSGDGTVVEVWCC